MQNNTNRRSAIDERTTRHDGYRFSLSKRWLVEEPFGWMKQIGGPAQGGAARLGQGRVAVCVYMCRLQPATDSKTEGAVCVNKGPSPAAQRHPESVSQGLH